MIARAGKSLVKGTALDAPEVPRRLGFLVGEISVLDDIDTVGTAELEALSGVAEWNSCSTRT